VTWNCFGAPRDSTSRAPGEYSTEILEPVSASTIPCCPPRVTRGAHPPTCLTPRSAPAGASCRTALDDAVAGPPRRAGSRERAPPRIVVDPPGFRFAYAELCPVAAARQHATRRARARAAAASRILRAVGLVLQAILAQLRASMPRSPLRAVQTHRATSSLLPAGLSRAAHCALQLFASGISSIVVCPPVRRQSRDRRLAELFRLRVILPPAASAP